MALIRITKEFNFETAHALLGYDGLCKNIHGHSYNLEVTVIGPPESDINSPKLGMVIDFGLMKKIVREFIVDPFDHALVLNSKTQLNSIHNNSELFGKLMKVSYQPTCENLLLDFVERLKDRFPENVRLFSMKLTETVTSHAEWYADDNL